MTLVSGWIKQKYQPKSTALYLMAKVLDVSELWLAGYDVPMEKSEAQKRAEHLNDLIELLENNDQYVRIIEYIVKLDENKLDAVEKMLSAFIVKEN